MGAGMPRIIFPSRSSVWAQTALCFLHTRLPSDTPSQLLSSETCKHTTLEGTPSAPTALPADPVPSRPGCGARLIRITCLHCLLHETWCRTRTQVFTE